MNRLEEDSTGGISVLVTGLKLNGLALDGAVVLLLIGSDFKPDAAEVEHIGFVGILVSGLKLNGLADGSGEAVALLA